jgi:hypothetical protein
MASREGFDMHISFKVGEQLILIPSARWYCESSRCIHVSSVERFTEEKWGLGTIVAINTVWIVWVNIIELVG